MALTGNNINVNNAIIRYGRSINTIQRMRGGNIDYPTLGIDCLTCHPGEVINRYTLPPACKACPIGRSMCTKKH